MEIPPVNIPNPLETSQSICFANKVTGFYTTQALTKRYLETDYNEICQSKKKKERKLLVKPKSYLGLRQDSQTALFPKTVNGLNPLTNFRKKLYPGLLTVLGLCPR